MGSVEVLIIKTQWYKGTTFYSQQQFIETKLIFHHIGNIVYTAEVNARGTFLLDLIAP